MKRPRPQLTDDQKGCILLRVVCGIDLDDIADLYGTSVIEVCRAAVDASDRKIVDTAFSGIKEMVENEPRKLALDWKRPTIDPYDDNEGGFVSISGCWTDEERNELEEEFGWEVDGNDAVFECDNDCLADDALKELPQHIIDKVTDYSYEYYSNALVTYRGTHDKLRNV